MSTVLKELSPLAELRSRAVASSADRESWLKARNRGVTATQAGRLLCEGASYWRELRDQKVSGEIEPPITGNRYIDRGNDREPIIADWVRRRFGIEPNQTLFHAVGEERYLATPDGIGYDLERGLVMLEIKTSKFDLDPTLTERTANGVVNVGHFWEKTRYWDQMQWQMHVAGPDVEWTLFVWEQHDDNWPNPQPLELEPRFAWIRRNQAHIDRLVATADSFVAEVEAKLAGELDDAAEDYEQLVAEWVRLDAEAAKFTAKRDEVKALIRDRIGDVDSFSVSTAAGKVSLSTSKPKPKFDEKLWAARAPKAFEAYQKAKKRYVSTPAGVASLRITPVKKEGDEQ